MAPEILRGEKYTEKADVYSFGVILWEMITGEIPYMGRSIPQITGIVGYYKETLKVPSSCNSKMRKLVNNCLLHEPERRPNFEHILQFLEDSPVVAEQQEAVAQPINRLFDLIT